MILIIGGAYQGKLDHAKKEYGLNENDIFECTEEKDLDLSKRCFYHFEKYLMYCYRNHISPVLAPGEDKIIIADDIFCGVVPLGAEIRGWRDLCGRSLSAVTAKADHVIRVFCGLPQVLK